jgi:hypothetical protein
MRSALAFVVSIVAGACTVQESAEAGPADGSIVLGADARPIRIDAHIFDARNVDGHPPPDARVIVDAGPPADAFVGDRFDVAYVNEWNLNSSGAEFVADQLAVFVNTGTTTLDMSSLTVLSVTDDRSDTDFIFRVDTPDSSSMRPGDAHGGIGNLNTNPLIAPLVPENIDVPVPEMTGGFTAHKGGSYDIHPKVMVQIGRSVAELDFLVHVTTKGGPPVEFVKAKRVSSAFPPDAGM